MSSDTDHLGRAIETVKQAIQADNAAEFDRAYRLYYTSLEFFMLALKQDQNESSRDAIRAKTQEYMNRAEKLKNYLAEEDHKRGEPSTTSASRGHVAAREGKGKGKEVEGKIDDIIALPYRGNKGNRSETDDLLICIACGTQFDVSESSLLKGCKICDDPRQFVPPTGQAFTTLWEMKKGAFKNRWAELDGDNHGGLTFWSIWTEPKFAIGQRAILITTPVGNVLWDCITFLDEETADRIETLGGIGAIVISHPHYYSTHLEWAKRFKCPVYLSIEDKEWLNRRNSSRKIQIFLENKEEEIEIQGRKTGVFALKLGGHFPGSLVCLADKRLLIADTLVTTPSGLGDWSRWPEGGTERPVGMNSFAFMWSIPNMIPLNPEEVVGMWDILSKYEFSSTHGAFSGQEIFDHSGGSVTPVKKRVLQSMQIQVRRMGWPEHAFLK